MNVGSFVASAGGVRGDERWFRDAQYALLFYEHGLLVTRIAGWDPLLKVDDSSERVAAPTRMVTGQG